LRSKIEPNPGKPSYIQTKRGVGYRFAAKVNYPAGQEPLALAG
jgi:DNA-binding winged helix-turn-helix (wHTH) protein